MIKRQISKNVEISRGSRACSIKQSDKADIIFVFLKMYPKENWSVHGRRWSIESLIEKEIIEDKAMGGKVFFLRRLKKDLRSKKEHILQPRMMFS